MFQDTASALFGVAGLRVTDVQAGPGGVLEVWAVTDCQGARRARTAGRSRPGCTTLVLTCPRDVRRAGDPVA